MSADLKALAEAFMAECDEETTGIVALDNLINAAMVHDCMATVEAFCGKPTETDRADNAEAARPKRKRAPEDGGEARYTLTSRSIHSIHCAPHARQVTCQPSGCTMGRVESCRGSPHVHAELIGRTGRFSARHFSADHTPRTVAGRADVSARRGPQQP